MDLYLPDDFIPHADYAWTDTLPAARSREEIALPRAGDDWLGGEALPAPALCRDLRSAAAPIWE